MDWTTPPLRTAAEELESGHRCFERRQAGAALVHYRRALELGLDPQEAVQERWMAAMLAGDFESAWAESDAVIARRRDSGESCADRPFHLRWVWNGQDLAGKSVLVRCYHGLGDIVQFIRYVPRLKTIAREVTVQAPAEILPLLRSAAGIDRLVPLSYDEPDPPFEADIELMELPHALRSTLGTVPAQVPYISAPPARLPSARLKVGIAWAAGEWRPERSLPLSLLAPLARIDGLAIYSLQRGPALAEAAESNFRDNLVNPEGAPVDIMDTASLVQALDLVISVDTFVAHLAGALAQPVYTLLHFHADWRWLAGWDDSPWYPTMRLFRQNDPGDWSRPVSDLIQAVAALEGCPETREC